MATHSSVLAWRIPGTGKPAGLPSMGSQSWTLLKRHSSSSSSMEPIANNDRGNSVARSLGFRGKAMFRSGYPSGSAVK